MTETFYRAVVLPSIMNAFDWAKPEDDDGAGESPCSKRVMPNQSYLVSTKFLTNVSNNPEGWESSSSFDMTDSYLARPGLFKWIVCSILKIEKLEKGGQRS